MFDAADYEAEPIEVWEDNLESVRVFSMLSTQWRAGMAGPTGLDYAAVLAVLRLHGLSDERARAVFEDIQTMEHAALRVIHRERK